MLVINNHYFYKKQFLSKWLRNNLKKIYNLYNNIEYKYILILYFI